MGRCVIVGGADINNYGFIREKLCTNDYMIFCDSGLKHLENLQVQPSLNVGDFDSHENPNLAVETIVLPCEKDDTDTVFAVKEAIKRGFAPKCVRNLFVRNCSPLPPRYAADS